MKILDLGCHDGYVGLYMARQLGVDVHLDGLELNEQAVEICRRRAAEYGIAGDYKIGLAEDAPDLFDPGTYDAVIAFELIEHVAEVDGFLDAAEAMLKPGGRIYLSTPDGTFGAGQNPHHLRVYRAVDLAALFRQRGTLEDMQVGPDGIAVVCYTPSSEPRLGEVAIYCGPGWQQWSPLDAEMPGKGLGGSETAAARLAEALQAGGYNVTVYAECEGGAFGQVIFRHHSVFDPLEPRLAVVSSRAPHLFDRPVNATRKLLWMHDTDYGPALTDERAVNIDAIMVLSDWQRDHVASLYPFIDEGKLRRTANGIVLTYFDTETAPQATRGLHRAVYSSSPDRGLDFLLNIWPQVRFHVPDAELAYCYSDVYDAVAAANPGLRAFRAKLNALAEQPGVTNLGSLSQPELARELQASGVWLNPGWCGPQSVRFHETYCIGAVEAAAAGCRRVMSDWGALPERTFSDAPYTQLVNGTDDEMPDADQWVKSIVEALTNDSQDHVASQEALDTTWNRVAEDFAEVINGALCPS